MHKHCNLLFEKKCWVAVDAMGKLKVCCLLLACLLLVLVAQQQTARPSEPIASTAGLSSSFRELIFKPLWLTGNESGNFMGWPT